MVSPKWQTIWIESQYCSKSVVNLPIPSQRPKKILEDLKTSCCSPNKVVQVEALKCWGVWIQNQNPDDWKLNAVCFTAVRPLITKKLQPLHKDVDICKLKLSLMWALLVKVQNIMHLEGPQYILEVFLQSCLTWLSSTNGDGNENEVSQLIFQLLLVVFNKNEILTGYDKEMFPPLSIYILHLKKVFHRLADSFVDIFIYWRKIEDKNVILKIWKLFLEQCELSYEHIPIPVWHKVFKLAGQICSEKDEPVKKRLAFLHSCATVSMLAEEVNTHLSVLHCQALSLQTLKSALSSSKFIDFGNLLTTPCEALLKKLMELCTTETNEFLDSEMFLHSKEICQVLSDKSVVISGYDLCIGVLDVLEEFCLRSLFWGVWCGLVFCYKTRLMNTDLNHFQKTEMKFYRKLRGIAVNFELDRNHLHKDCINEVEKHIGFLNISCFCSVKPDEVQVLNSNEKHAVIVQATEVKLSESFSKSQSVIGGVSKEIVPVASKCALGRFSMVTFPRKKNLVPRKVVTLNLDLVKYIFSTLNIRSTETLLSSMFSFRFISTESAHCKAITPRNLSFQIKVEVNKEKEIIQAASPKIKVSSPVSTCNPVKKKRVVIHEAYRGPKIEENVISTPRTRSRKRAEEEMKLQRRKKRKTFEVLVQEIVKKNKERKTEKNSRRRKSPDMLKNKKNKKKVERPQIKQKQKASNICGKDNKLLDVSDRKLRNSKKDEPKNKKKKENFFKTDGKLENYFKVITKKAENEAKKEVKKRSKPKKTKEKTSESCCNSEKEEKEKKGETNWRQTSLKAMMNSKSRIEKVKQGMRARVKAVDVIEEKFKMNDEKVTGTPLAKLSPFKEVFHDHEYAKIQPGKMKSLERVLIAKKEKKAGTREFKEKPSKKRINEKIIKPKVVVIEKVEFLRPNDIEEENPESRENKKAETKASEILDQSSTSEKSEFRETEVMKLSTPKKFNHQEVEKHERIILVESETKAVDHAVKENESANNESEMLNLEFLDRKSENKINHQDVIIGLSVSDLTCDEIGKKRFMIDGLKPSKKIKLEEEEDPVDDKLPLEITEKENMKEKQTELISPTKKEKPGGPIPRSNGSPNVMNGGMSRALRIIGLVPESTKSRTWESPKVETSKCKKAPNVDKNSRASKMLALLTENVEPEEVVETNEEEIFSCQGLAATPNAKTPLSSLKSPKSVKKRRSIRFDDARNETVLYQTDTPPSQILEEKEKRRGARPFKNALHLP